MEINPSNTDTRAVQTQIKPTAAQAPAAPVIRLSAQNPAQVVVPPEQNIEDMLKLLGFRPAKENIELVLNLVTTGLPATKENILNLNKALKLTGDMNAAIFLLENAKVNTENAGLLKSFANQELQILGELAEIIDAIENMPDGELKNELAQILLDDNTAESAAVPESNVYSSKNSAETDAQVLRAETPGQEPVAPQTEQPVIIQRETTGSEPSAALAPQTENAVPDKSELPPREIPAEVSAGEPASPEVIQSKSAAPEVLAGSENTVARGEIPERAEILAELLLEPDVILDENIPEIKSEQGENPLRQSRQAIIEEDKALQSQILEKEETSAPKTAQNAGKTAKPGFLTKALDKYAVKPEQDGLKDFDKRLNKLKDDITLLKNRVARADNSEPLMNKLDKVAKSLDFFNELKKAVYLQFPVALNEKKTNAELFVFRRDKGKKQKAQGSAQSALLSLDLPNLGHFEAYLQKNGQAVTCGFRVAEETAALIAASISTLSERLHASGYSLNGYSFTQVSEPFTILDKEPDVAGKNLKELHNLNILA